MTVPVSVVSAGVDQSMLPVMVSDVLKAPLSRDAYGKDTGVYHAARECREIACVDGCVKLSILVRVP